MLERTVRILAAAVLGCALATASDAAEGTEVPACPLLTSDEVRAVLGIAVEAEEQPPSGGDEGQGRMTTCLWVPAGGRLGASLSLVVWSWPPGDGRAQGYLAALRAAAEEFPDLPPPETLAIADDAVWDGDRVHVRKGDMNFTLATSLNALDATPDAKAKLVTLAALVAARL